MMLFKSADPATACAAGSTCTKELICNMRAGQSSDACASTKRKVGKRADNEDSTDVTKLDDLFKRDEPHPWNTNLCGLPFDF